MVTDAVENSDVELFDSAVGMLDELRMLDDWKTHVLLVIKKRMEDLT
jgi:alpha-soluble NSF attachment protein